MNCWTRQAGRHDWFYYTATKCAIPDDMVGLNIPVPFYVFERTVSQNALTQFSLRRRLMMATWPL
jgi:hypothetical protein